MSGVGVGVGVGLDNLLASSWDVCSYQVSWITYNDAPWFLDFASLLVENNMAVDFFFVDCVQCIGYKNQLLFSVWIYRQYSKAFKCPYWLGCRNSLWKYRLMRLHLNCHLSLNQNSLASRGNCVDVIEPHLCSLDLNCD